MKPQMSILLLSKSTEWGQLAQQFLATHCEHLVIEEGDRDQKFPSSARTWAGDYIISFLSPWIVVPEVLQRATRASINFHPAPPEYPGIGCYNFALYDEVKTYGVTCHHMTACVDSGPIIEVVRFPLFPTDTIRSLKDRSMVQLLALFYKICSLILNGGELPQSLETWRRKPYTRRELDALCRIESDMPAAEVQRRVRATSFAGYPGPYIEHAGYKFTLSSDQ